MTQELTQRQQARLGFTTILDSLISHGVLSTDMIAHYKGFLITNEKHGEENTAKMEWDPLYNHRANTGDPSAINGTRNEMIASAALRVLSDDTVFIETDKTMQVYGRDLKQGKKSFSVKGRIHEALAPGGYLLRLEMSDFKPGQYRIDQIVFVDSDLITFVNYRPLARMCTTIVNNIPKELLKNSLYTKEFETKFPSCSNTYKLQDLWDAYYDAHH
jgi:hypothetical protein